MPAFRLPARPSLEQLRRQAKERLDTLRATRPTATLAEAQFALAREYGFESWPKLVRHVEAVRSDARIPQFDDLARDLLVGYGGDAAALGRLIAHYGLTYSPGQYHVRLRSRLDDSRGATAGAPALADARALVAREYGFESWAALAESLAQPSSSPPDERFGSATPPFFAIDSARRTINVKGPLTDADWDTICNAMRERGLTGLKTAAMTERGLARLSRLDGVTSLEIGGPALTDEGLAYLARMPQLERLELGGPVTDRGLAVLRHLPQLKVLALPWLQTVSDAGLKGLRFCDRLESVDLMGTPSGDGVLDALRGKPALRHVKTGRLVTDAGLRHLHDFPVFRSWQGGEIRYGLMTFTPEPNSLLLDGPFTDEGLAGLVGLDGLFGLSLFRHTTAFSARGLGALAGLARLGFLACPGERCDDAAMARLAALPGLRMLVAQGAIATDQGFLALRRSRTLEYLWGRECPKLRGRGFEALATMPALRGLGVSCRFVEDAALAALPRFPALRQLVPMDVTDAGFRHIGACTRLEDLWCMYCRDIGDEATEHLAGLRLRMYYAGKTRITDRSCEILGRMSSLEEIELWECAEITDAGLAALATLPDLRQLTITGSPRVTPRGVAALPAAVRVEYSP